MDPTVFIAMGAGVLAVGAAIGAGVQHALLRRKQAFLAATQESLEAQRFTVEKAKTRVAQLTSALIARDERVTVHLAPTFTGATASVVVRGVKAASRATFRVSRERLANRLARRTGIVIGDPGFDERHHISGWPKDQTRAFAAAPKVKNAIEAMFGFDDVVELSLVAFQDDGGVRVSLDLEKGRMGALRPVAELALTVADALDEVRFTDPAPKPASALPEGGAGVEGGAPVGVPGIPPKREGEHGSDAD